MFSKKENKPEKPDTMFAGKDRKPGKVSIMERNVIAKNTTVVGDIKSDGDFRIDGRLEGTLKTNGRIIIGTAGSIKGNVEAVDADIEGALMGQLVVSKTLTIKTSANVSGDVVIGKLSVEIGAIFNATCSMKGTVKELKQTNEKKKSSEKTA